MKGPQCPVFYRTGWRDSHKPSASLCPRSTSPVLTWTSTALYTLACELTVCREARPVQAETKPCARQLLAPRTLDATEWPHFRTGRSLRSSQPAHFSEGETEAQGGEGTFLCVLHAGLVCVSPTSPEHQHLLASLHTQLSFCTHEKGAWAVQLEDGQG